MYKTKKGGNIMLNLNELKVILEEWFTKIETEDNIPDDIVGINIGIIKKSDYRYKFYLTGAKKFNYWDDNWACIVDYEPKNKTLDIPVEVASGIIWCEFLDYLENILLEIKEKHRNYKLFNIENMTFGFDTGSLVYIGNLQHNLNCC